jgi:hypothetical protein
VPEAAELPDFAALGRALRAHDEVVARWLDAYVGSVVRVPRPVDRGALAQLIAPLVEALADAVEPSRRPGGPPGVRELRPGAAELREVEKAAALLGGGLAVGDASGFDVAALMLAARIAFEPVTAGAGRRQVADFAEWLAVVALDAFTGARVAAERERWREQLEDGTPALLVAPEVPAAFLIGRPDARLLDSVFGRLILLTVRVGARTVLVDVSGLSDAGHPVVLAALGRLLAHPKLRGKVHLVVVGATAEVEAAWQAVGEAHGCRLSADTHFDRALSDALSAAGVRVLRS